MGKSKWLKCPWCKKLFLVPLDEEPINEYAASLGYISKDKTAAYHGWCLKEKLEAEGVVFYER